MSTIRGLSRRRHIFSYLKNIFPGSLKDFAVTVFYVSPQCFFLEDLGTYISPSGGAGGDKKNAQIIFWVFENVLIKSDFAVRDFFFEAIHCSTVQSGIEAT